MTYPNAIDVMEAAASAALARYLEAIGNHTPRTIAERAYRDQILKAWERTALKAIDQRVEAAVSAYQARQADDTPARTRARREQLDQARSEACVAALRRGREKSTA